MLLIVSAFLFFGTVSYDFKNQKKTEKGWNEFSVSHHPVALNSILEESIEIPGFQLHLKFNGLNNFTWIPSFLDSRKDHLLSTIFKKSFPLFDVKDTYFHFFYSW